MRAKIDKEAFEKIKFLFSKASKEKNNFNAKKYVSLARTIAKRKNIRIPKRLRRKFCHKCNTYFNSKNRKIRIKNKVVSIKCLNCNKYTRYKIINKNNKK